MQTSILTKIIAGAALFGIAACGEASLSDKTPAPAQAGGVDDSAPASTSAVVVNRDWMPTAIDLPQGHSIIQETQIGSRTHLLQVSVGEDPRRELARWQDALQADGYEVNETMVFDGRLLFEGDGIESGQIAVMAGENGSYIIQVDVSLN